MLFYYDFIGATKQFFKIDGCHGTRGTSTNGTPDYDLIMARTLCSYRIKMDENGAQESHIDFYAQFNSLKA